MDIRVYGRPTGTKSCGFAWFWRISTATSFDLTSLSPTRMARVGSPSVVCESNLLNYLLPHRRHQPGSRNPRITGEERRIAAERFRDDQAIVHLWNRA